MLNVKYNSSRLIFAVLILCACGQSPDGPVGVEGTGGYRAHLVFPQEAYVGGRTAKGLTDIDCAGQGIDMIEFNIICEDGHQYGPHRFACTAGRASIPGVPAGKGVVVEVSADDAAGNPLYEGSEVVDIIRDQVTQGGEIAMEPIDPRDTDTNTDTSTNTDTTGTNGDLTVETTSEGIVIRELSMYFVYIQSGNFNMGSLEEEPAGQDDERPRHQVTFTEGYYMQATEVTQWQYEEIMGEHTFGFPNCGEECPAENVTWNDAQDFIEALNDRVVGDYEFRLPTEAEWEYAARAGTSTAYFFGDSLTTAQANFYNSDSDYHGPIPVGTLIPDEWGLYDMHGNVWEWVEDDWHTNYQNAPPNGIAWIDDPRGDYRVLRGGGWGDDVEYCRSAFRYGSTPDYRLNYFGFRLAASLVSR